MRWLARLRKWMATDPDDPNVYATAESPYQEPERRQELSSLLAASARRDPFATKDSDPRWFKYSKRRAEFFFLFMDELIARGIDPKHAFDAALDYRMKSDQPAPGGPISNPSLDPEEA